MLCAADPGSDLLLYVHLRVLKAKDNLSSSAKQTQNCNNHRAFRKKHLSTPKRFPADLLANDILKHVLRRILLLYPIK